MPTARPSLTTTSNISVLVCISTFPSPHLPHEGLVGPEQELLTGLASGVERARDLGAPERAIGQEPAVLAGERHALCGALVDDLNADLCEAIHIRFPRAIVAALHRVVKEPPDGVAVVLIVLRSVDAPLRRNAVGSVAASRDR